MLEVRCQLHCWRPNTAAIGQVRYIIILAWLRGFQEKLLYPVVFSFYPSLLWRFESRPPKNPLGIWELRTVELSVAFTFKPGKLRKNSNKNSQKFFKLSKFQPEGPLKKKAAYKVCNFVPKFSEPCQKIDISNVVLVRRFIYLEINYLLKLFNAHKLINRIVLKLIQQGCKFVSFRPIICYVLRQMATDCLHFYMEHCSFYNK